MLPHADRIEAVPGEVGGIDVSGMKSMNDVTPFAINSLHINK